MEFRNSQADSNIRSNARRYPEPTRPSAANDNVSVSSQGDGTETPVNTMRIQRDSDGKLPKSIIPIIIAVALIVVLLVGGWLVWSKIRGSDAAVKSDQYQAVFLTNGQVYFCKLSDVTRSYVKCNNIYYLQVQQSVQPDDKNKNQQSQVSLAKLGSELHGPEDTMYISREQVLFWENLKNDGKVVQAINSYKQQNK